MSFICTNLNVAFFSRGESMKTWVKEFLKMPGKATTPLYLHMVRQDLEKVTQ